MATRLIWKWGPQLHGRIGLGLNRWLRSRAHMGQNVEINRSVTMGDVLVVDTDRSFTGQDGHAITPGSDGHGVPGTLAERLFALGLGIDHVFVLQNAVTVRRSVGWHPEAAQTVEEVVHTFLRFYPDRDEEG